MGMIGDTAAFRARGEGRLQRCILGRHIPSQTPQIERDLCPDLAMAETLKKATFRSFLP